MTYGDGTRSQGALRRSSARADAGGGDGRKLGYVLADGFRCRAIDRDRFEAAHGSDGSS
jgi:hypothetical protein